MSKPAVSDPALARLIDPLYRPNATVGSVVLRPQFDKRLRLVSRWAVLSTLKKQRTAFGHLSAGY
jgi:hypothetical protein